MGRFFIVFILTFSNFFNAAQADPKDLPNFAQVNQTLYRGGRPTYEGLKQLAGKGIKTVINLQGGDLHSIFAPIAALTEKGELKKNILIEGNEVKNLGMNYRSYPLNSINSISKQEAIRIQSILADIENPELQPVYVHCQHGKDRTGLIIALERVQDEGWTTAEAKAEWVQMGHGTIAQIITGSLDHYFKIITQ